MSKEVEVALVFDAPHEGANRRPRLKREVESRKQGHGKERKAMQAGF